MKLCEGQRPAENGCPPPQFINACEGMGRWARRGEEEPAAVCTAIGSVLERPGPCAPQG